MFIFSVYGALLFLSVFIVLILFLYLSSTGFEILSKSASSIENEAIETAFIYLLFFFFMKEILSI